jgi:TPR repeat protein
MPLIGGSVRREDLTEVDGFPMSSSMRFSALAGLVLLLPFCWYARGGDLPELAQLKVDAEKGNTEAQSRLADRYLSSFEFVNATKWYRLAAQKGNLNAQWNLGVILLKGKPAFPNRSAAVPPEPEQGLAWLLRAGAQEHERAQIDLGHCYRDGTAAKQDLPEAYKWYSLAARKTRTWKPLYLDPLILRMTTEQIAEGQNG